jgi:hypothetical protein
VELVKNSRIIISISLLIFCLAVDLSPEEKKGASQSVWKIKDVVEQESAGNFSISPDGSWALWVKTFPDKEKYSRTSHIFLSSRKSPDDKIPGSGFQIWLMDKRGGEPWKITSLPFGVPGI